MYAAFIARQQRQASLACYIRALARQQQRGVAQGKDGLPLQPLCLRSLSRLSSLSSS